MQPLELLLDENLSPSIGVEGHHAMSPEKREHEVEEVGALLRGEQEQVVRDGIAAIEAEYAAGRDMVNRVLRIDLAGSKAFETLPPPSQP